MTPEQDINETIRRRKSERAARRKKAEQLRRRTRLQLLAVAVVVAAAVGMIAVFSRGAGTPAPTEPVLTTTTATEPQTEPTDAPPSETAQVPDASGQAALTQPTQPATQPPATEPSEPAETAQEEFTVIHIAAAGDLNVTDQVVANALGKEGYDFDEVFRDVSPVLSGADLTVLNLEGTFAGVPYGAERGSAPPELAQALRNMGVDAVQTANSASIRAGILGLQSTIDSLYGAGILPIGTFRDADAYRDSGGYTMVEIQGIRIALVGFTKGMDNLGLPEGSEDCVNVLYEDYFTTYKDVNADGIRRVLRRVEEEQPDLTIAMLHWGSEYNEGINDTQKRIRNLMLEGGVDIILGTHPHLVQTIDYNREENTLVAYSLGDFYGDAEQPGSNYSLVLDIEVTRDNLTGEVRITGFDYTPIFTVRPEDSAAGGQRVVRIREAMERYESNYLGKVTEDIYDDMNYALKRLGERIRQEIE